jgi:hypothetical protein
MHNHSNDNYLNFKNRVNDLGLAFDGKVGLGPFWTLVQVLLYNNVVHVSVSSSVSSFRHHAYSYRSGDLHEDANARFN